MLYSSCSVFSHFHHLLSALHCIQRSKRRYIGNSVFSVSRAVDIILSSTQFASIFPPYRIWRLVWVHIPNVQVSAATSNQKRLFTVLREAWIFAVLRRCGFLWSLLYWNRSFERHEDKKLNGTDKFWFFLSRHFCLCIWGHFRQMLILWRLIFNSVHQNISENWS